VLRKKEVSQFFFPIDMKKSAKNILKTFCFPIDMYKSETKFVKASNFVFRFLHVNLKKNWKHFFFDFCISIGKKVNFFKKKVKNIFEPKFFRFLHVNLNNSFLAMPILSGNEFSAAMPLTI